MQFHGVQTVQGKSTVQMRGAVYNSAIPNVIQTPARRALSPAARLRLVVQLSCMLLGLANVSRAADWSGPEQQLARKIVAVTGPVAVALTVENRSHLGKRDSEIIQNGLRSALQGLGIRFVKQDQAAASVAISLSENVTSYVWVAEIHRGAGESAVVMVSAPSAEGATSPHESVPLSLRKTSLWSQASPILDVAVLEENTTPTRIAVLDAEKVALYRLQSGRWNQEQALAARSARKADPGERSLAGCVSSGSDVPHCCRNAIHVDVPRDRRSMAISSGGLERRDTLRFSQRRFAAGSHSGGGSILCVGAQFFHRRVDAGGRQTHDCVQVLLGCVLAAREISIVDLRRDGRLRSYRGWDERSSHQAGMGKRSDERQDFMRRQLAGSCHQWG